jgi:hypothetical protein
LLLGDITPFSKAQKKVRHPRDSSPTL